MLEEYVEYIKERIGYKSGIEVRIRHLKASIAKTSFKDGVITLDPVVLKLEKEEILYILAHEIAHLKSGTPYHTQSFWSEIEKIFPKEKVEEMEKRIIKRIGRIWHNKT